MAEVLVEPEMNNPACLDLEMKRGSSKLCALGFPQLQVQSGETPEWSSEIVSYKRWYVIISCQEVFGAKTLQWDFVIEAWAAARRYSHGIKTLVGGEQLWLIWDRWADETMKLMNLVRLGDDVEVKGVQNSNTNKPKAGRQSYLKIQLQDNRLTVKVCHWIDSWYQLTDPR